MACVPRETSVRRHGARPSIRLPAKSKADRRLSRATQPNTACNKKRAISRRRTLRLPALDAPLNTAQHQASSYKKTKLFAGWGLPLRQKACQRQSKTSFVRSKAFVRRRFMQCEQKQRRCGQKVFVFEPCFLVGRYLFLRRYREISNATECRFRSG